MLVDVIDSYEAFAALESNWNALYLADPDAQFFLSWTWLSRVFHDHPEQWRVLAVKPDEPDADYIGFFPTSLRTIWSKSRRMFRNEIHMAGRLSWAQYTGFICHPDREEEVARHLAEHIKTMYWSRISLKYFYCSDERIECFMDQFPDELFRKSYDQLTINKGATNNLACPYVDLPEDYETYLKAHVSANTRQKIRRFMRQVENTEDLFFSVSDKTTIDRDLDILVDLWTRQWEGSKGRKAKDLAATYRRILQNSFACGTLHLPVLWRGDTPLGALGSLVDWQKRRLHFIVASRDELQPEPFVGWVLHADSIRWAIDNGIKIYDFCHGDESYKYSYGAQDHHVKYASISTRSGANLNGILDPACFDDVLARTIKFINTDRIKEANIACEQARMMARKLKIS